MARKDFLLSNDLLPILLHYLGDHSYVWPFQEEARGWLTVRKLSGWKVKDNTMNDSVQLMGAKFDMLGCIFSVDLWGIEQGRGGGGRYFWLPFEGTIWLLCETVSANNCERRIAVTLFVGSDVAFEFLTGLSSKKKKKKKMHGQQSGSAAVPSMATIKDENPYWPMNRRIESSHVRGVCWWTGAEMRWRDFPDSSSVEVLSKWFCFFLWPRWHQGQAHSWRATDSWHRKAAALYHNWSAVPILVHHMTLVWTSYPYSQRDISRGWMRDELLCVKNIFLLLSPVPGKMKEKPTVCRRCRCSRTAGRGFCSGRVHWTGLMLLEVCSPWWLLLANQSNINSSKSPIWTLDWTEI